MPWPATARFIWENILSREDLTAAESHFAFGDNWASYAERIDEPEIDEAVRGLSRLLGGERLDGKRVLDIGSGSGLHALAALRLGAREVVAVDLDADSVATSRAVLDRHAPQGGWRVERLSVFDLAAAGLGDFDVVYSWGVLHHTGAMTRAIECAARAVGPGGLFVFALYRRVWMDGFWRLEKRWYANASPVAQRRARAAFVALFAVGLRVTGRNLAEYRRDYGRNRGMDFEHDVHDWLGGWPYESISAGEVDALLAGLGCIPVRRFVRHGKLFGRDPGVFATGCDEYVFRRPSDHPGRLPEGTS